MRWCQKEERCVTGGNKMRDVNIQIKVEWTCQKCGTRNSYQATRTDVDVLAPPGVHRQKCCGCERGKEAEMSAELIIK